jgi:Flp pilus assembly protein TadG
MVETAVVIIPLLFLTMGLIQAGFIYNAMLSLNNLSREGARFAGVRAQQVMTDPLFNTETAKRDEIKRQVVEHLQKRAVGTTIEPAKLAGANIVIQAPTLKKNAPVRVLIRYDMKRNKGLIPGLLPLPDRYANYEAGAVNLIE